MKTVRNRTIPKAANSAVNTFGNEIVTTLKSIARHYGGEYKPNLAGGSITVPDSPLVLARIGTTGRTPKNHVEVIIENLPLSGYAYEDSDYNVFSKATQALSSVGTNMKVQYRGVAGAVCTFAVDVDDISKFSTLFQNAVLRMFPEKSAPSRTAASRKKLAVKKASKDDFDDIWLLLDATVQEDKRANPYKLQERIQDLHRAWEDVQGEKREIETKLADTVKDVTDRFVDMEDGLDKVVRALRDLERKHPELSGYDFDDLVGGVESLSDDARAARFEFADI